MKRERRRPCVFSATAKRCNMFVFVASFLVEKALVMRVASSLPALMVSDVPSDALRFCLNDKRVDSFCGDKIRNGRAARWTRPFDVFANQIIDFSFQRMVYLLINFLPFCITTPL